MRTFLLGVLVALPIVLVEHVISGGPTSSSPRPPTGAAVMGFIVAGVVEELGKFLLVRISLYDSPYFDSPLRGLVFASVGALGFASIENVEYMFTFGPEVLGPRAVLAPLGHVAFSALWGYGLGANRRALLQGQASRGYAILGLLAAIAAHGAYDLGIFVENPALTLASFAAVGVTCIVLFVTANGGSHHGGRTAVSFVECRAPLPSGKRFCSMGGVALGRERYSACRTPLPDEVAYCAACGVRVDSSGT